MKFKTNQKMIWTPLELTELLEEDDSCVDFKRTQKHLALHPFHLKNFQKALNEILMFKVNSYDTELKGFLIAYKNPKLLSNLGEIFYDSCFIHIDVEADFYLFCPKVGCSLKGIVNKKGLDHIVLLVHKVFTVTIPKPDNEEEEEWLGNTVEIGQEVKCCVTQIDRSTKLPFISATLNANYLQGCRLPEVFNNISDTGINIKSNINNINEVINDSNILEDNNEETHKIKIEVPDREEHTWGNVESGYQLQNNDIDLCDNTESHKRKKRERSETDTNYEPEKKKKKKHAKKSKEFDSEIVYMTKNEENIINDTINTVKEEQQNNKKRKKTKKVSMMMSDSEPEDSINKIKEEKPDLVILNQVINESSRKSSTYENMKTEDADKTDKDKKKKSKKHEKLKNIDSEFEIKIKSEDISLGISDQEYVSKKRKNRKKSPTTSPDSKSKYVKIKKEEDD